MLMMLGIRLHALLVCPALTGAAHALNGDIVVAQDGSGDYSTVQAAVNAVPQNHSERTVIFIKPGTYKEKIKVPADRKNVTFAGESCENTILTFDDYGGKTKDYASTRVYADDFSAVGITFQNTIDSRMPEIKGGQAAALRIDGDRATFYQCRIMGFQDTYYTGGNRRSYHRDCEVIGTTDFIYGDGIALFENCTIYSRKDSHITAHSQGLKDGKPANQFGYVFKKCHIKQYPGEEVSGASLGRPWRNGARVVYLNCEIGSHIKPEGWSTWNRNENHLTAYYAEHKNTGPGSGLQSRPKWTHQLTEEQASAYTKENIFKASTTTATKLEGDWNPDVDALRRIASNIKAAVRVSVAVQEPVPGMTPPMPFSMPYGIPAFPGAWGGGMFSTGGRGGRVIVVTNTQDGGPGSLREAIDAQGPRIVVFRVAGLIELKSDLNINNPHITIAGQTAPGDGICISKRTLNINTDNVILRHLRSRMGVNGGDCIGGHPRQHVIVDHCSASWGHDENLSLYRYQDYRPDPLNPTNTLRIKTSPRNLTIQYSISSECLGPGHEFGGTWGGQDSTFHHNLFACNTGRNPSIGMSGEFDYRNNVIFNWGHRSMDGGDETSLVNVINNYYKPGPATLDNMLSTIARIEQRRQYSPESRFRQGDWYPQTETRPGKWYVAGNIVEGHPDVTADNWKGMKLQEGGGTIETARVNTPFKGWPVNQHTALQAFNEVLARSGATLPRRDAVDKRIVEMVRTGTVTFGSGIIVEPNQVGGYPQYAFSPDEVPADKDGDGMPDAWEEKYGLNPSDPADGTADSDGDGYTNMEEYLNGTNPREKIDYTDFNNNVDTIS